MPRCVPDDMVISDALARRKIIDVAITAKGVVRGSGHIVVTDCNHCRHLRNEALGACFGEWNVAQDRGGEGGAASTLTYEIVLMPEESIYLACVVGCLDVVTNDDEPAFGSEARLGELLRLLVKTDPDLVAAASTWGDTGADGLSKGFQREDGSAREESSARCSKRPRATRDGTGFRGRDAHFESDDGIPCCPGVERAALIRALAYAHFRHQGLVVKDGVLLGCHFLLYRGSPADVHSDYGVWVQGAEVGLHSRSQLGCGVEGFPEDRESSSDESWLHVNRLSRLLQDVSKRLVVCAVETGPPTRVVELSFN